MRPIRLELEGFTAYREFTAIDFDGADLFVLTGPTGSGKSSIIDALTFALYGSVPRYGNPNIVHPVISQGKLEAKVRFDFSIGERTFTAVRVVRRNPKGTGATTKEARLESKSAVLAGTADEVSRKVRELLGLNFEQFTTCVVLPQGEFARFLHDKPAQRQDLLTKLLGVDIYEAMGNLARVREAEAKQSVKLQEDELGRLKDATPTAVRAAERRVRDLEKLKTEVEEAQPEIEALGQEVEAHRADAEKLREGVQALEKVAVPKGISDLARKIERAKGEARETREARTAAHDALKEAEAAQKAFGSTSGLSELLRLAKERAEAAPLLDRASKEAQSSRRDVEETQRELEVSKKELAAARESLDEARRLLAAHDLAAHLERGKPCPVCQRKVTTLPERALPFGLKDAESRAREAEARKESRLRRAQEAEKRAALAEERAKSLRDRVTALDEKLEGAPAISELEKTLSEIAEGEERLRTARERARLESERETRAHDRLARLADEEKAAWERFEKTRDRLASLAPPRTDRENLGEAWEKLASWARESLSGVRRRAAKATEAAEKASALREERSMALHERCAKLDVPVQGVRPRDAVVEALAEAEQERRRISEALARAVSLREAIASEGEKARVAGALGQHLRATGFERWLLEEAFRRLVSGATGILKELSSGQYSFEYDDRLNFEVVDHRNADERRSARTLSGGETFLASLALALTLAEQTADLAARGSARLESLFLDEGFGTLDDDTLEVVASAIEELGARGRIVGLVTHQQSLAEKIPVQYRVSKGVVTATVEKVVA